MKLKNHYYILRHGQAFSNQKMIVSCWPEKIYNPLTSQGKKQIKEAAEKLKDKKIDLIFSSDLLRTRQTAEIVSKILKIKPIYDKRLREYNVGVLNGESIAELRETIRAKDRFSKKPRKGETYNEIKKRMYSFLREKEKKYKDKNILIISHQLPLALLELKIRNLKNKEFFNENINLRLSTGQLRKLS